jgi:hypothetical protein
MAAVTDRSQITDKCALRERTSKVSALLEPSCQILRFCSVTLNPGSSKPMMTFSKILHILTIYDVL